MGSVADFRDEYRARRRGSFPRGDNGFSIRNTWRFRRDPLNLLLESYERYGPIFGMRIVFGYNLAMIGPEANHFMLVSGRENFGWRHGRMGDLLTLIGDGLLTTDGDYHDGSRAIMMPAFHRERVIAATEVMGSEAETRRRCAAGRGRAPTSTRWTRDLAMRIAMRRAVRLRPRFGPGRRDRGPVRERPQLPRPRVPDADAVRAGNAAGEAASATGRPSRGSSARRSPAGASAARTATTSSPRCSPRPTRRATRSATGRSSTTSSPCSSPATTRRPRPSASSIYELARNPDWADRLAAELSDVCGPREPTAAELSAACRC